MSALRALFFIATIIALIAPRAEAQGTPAGGHLVELAVMAWKPEPTLILSVESSGTTISDIDFVDEFSIDDEWFPDFRVTLGRRHKLRTGYVRFSYQAEAVIQRTFRFGGRTFTVGAPAATDIQWDLWTLGYEWDFVSSESGFLGIFADLKYNKVEAVVDSPVLRQTAVHNAKAAVPAIGVVARGHLTPALAITGAVGGFKISRNELDIKNVDFDLNGTVLFGPNLGAQVGYRSVIIDYVIDDDAGDLKMQGPYVGGLLRF